MRTGSWARAGLAWMVAFAPLLGVNQANAALTLYDWTLDGKPPTVIDDMHLHLQIVKTPFTFGGVLIDDDGNFNPATAGGSVPAADGSFTVDFDGADPAYGTSDNIHVAFNFVSSEDVKLVFIEWTLGGRVVGRTQGQDPNWDINIRQTVVPAPSTLATLAVGLLLIGGMTKRRHLPG